MEREDNQGEIEQIHLPLRLTTITLLDSTIDGLLTIAENQMASAISRLSDFCNMGSGWVFVRLVSAVATVALNLDRRFNSIGYETAIDNQRRRYGSSAKYHLQTNKSGCILW